MGREFFHRDIQLFMDHRVDWPRYFRLRDGDAVHPEDEVDTYRTILRTVGEICEDIESGALEHWHEEVRLEDGKVIVPPHISAGYASGWYSALFGEFVLVREVSCACATDSCCRFEARPVEHWTRENEQSNERASAFASIVFPTPGKSSMIR